MEALKMEDTAYTIKDVLALPRGRRAELIDGDMYMMAPPRYAHQRVLMSLSYTIKDYIKKKGGSCEVIPAPFGVYLSDDDENLVEPDISVICDRSKIDEDGCHGAPDWIIEIMSPTSKKLDCFIKMNKYRESGVREYWIVDPKTETVRVFDFEESEQRDYSFEDTVKVKIYEDLYIDFKEINA